MRKIILLVAFIFCAVTFSYSQVVNWGIKGGLNYNSNGDLVNNAENIIDSPNGNAGFHLGVFAQTKGGLFIRPELVYTQTKSDYSEGGDFKMSKIDLPVLGGIKILHVLYIIAGPSFQYIINTDLEKFDLKSVENDFTIGGVVGIGAQFGKLGVDVRYERGFTNNEASFLNVGEIGTLDTRQKQIIASVSFKF